MSVSDWPSKAPSWMIDPLIVFVTPSPAPTAVVEKRAP